jgi:hypothetical protein
MNITHQLFTDISVDFAANLSREYDVFTDVTLLCVTKERK